jgi:L-asparaginase II
MSAVALVETTRALPDAQGTVENVHYGAIAVVDTSGRVRYSAGNPEQVSFTRSALKPFQALPFLRARGHEHFALTPPELALLCSSHSGEEHHVSGVARLLARIGCSESDLRCGAHVPLYYAAVGATPPADASWNQLHNNCSGKHSGFLAWCCLLHASRADYLDPGHPLQVAIRGCVGELTGTAEDAMPCGIDGCSAPNYALPLARLAHLYARLARDAHAARDGEALGVLFDAMTGHPDLVSGEGRTDLAYMRVGRGDWVTKAGADGVQAFGSRSAGLGVALKIWDGTPRALHAAFVSTLRQLGLLEGRDTALLAAWSDPLIRNHRGLVTGQVRANFRLERHN